MTLFLANKRFRRRLIAAVVVSGLAMSILVAWSSYNQAEKFRQEHFNNAVENRYFALKRALDHSMHVLESLQALYLATQDLERSELLDRVEFQDFTNYVLKAHTSIQTLEWAPRVPDSERKAYESAARRDGFPDFQFTERTSPGKMNGAEQRKEYFPVYFVEPFSGNTAYLGFDLASDIERRTVMERAARSGEILATGRIALAEESGNQFGFMVFAPVYRKGVPTNTDQARLDNLEGFMLGVFRINALVEAAIRVLEPEGIDISISDASASGEERFLYLHESRIRKTPLEKKPQSEAGYQKDKTLGFAGRQWLIISSAAPEFFATGNSLYHWGLLLTGVTVTGLVTLFLVFSGRHAELIEKSARDKSNANTMLTQEMTERRKVDDQLRNKEHLLSESQRLGHVGSFFMDATGLMQWSAELFHLFGVSPGTLTPNMESLLSLIHPEDRSTMQVWIEDCMAGKKPAALEFRVIFADGTIRFIRGDGEAVFDDQNSFLYLAGSAQDITERKHVEQELQLYSAELEKKNEELQEALAKVKQLTGMLPICASCKKIRDDSGYWSGVETYVSEHTDVVFSHGLCPECVGKAYEDLAQFKQENK